MYHSKKRDISNFLIKESEVKMYSPKISEQYIPVLYRKSKELKIPMTKLVNQIIHKALEDAGDDTNRAVPVGAQLYHRRMLAGELPDLELKISTYLEVNNISRLSVSGYRVEVKEEGLLITEAPGIDENQLSLIPDYFCLEIQR